MTWLKTYRIFAAAMAVVVALLAPRACAAQSSITIQDVQHALAAQGVNISEGQIGAIPNVSRRKADASLSVTELRVNGKNSAEVRIRCRNAGECLPFFARLSWPSGEEMRAATQAFTAVEQSPRQTQKRPLIRMGSSAVLLLLSQHSEIRIPVISLQNGAVGETIRIISRDRKQLFHAQVAGERLLTMRAQ